MGLVIFRLVCQNVEKTTTKEEEEEKEKEDEEGEEDAETHVSHSS